MTATAWTAPPEPPVEPARLSSELVDWLRGRADPVNVAGMARYGISTRGTLGVPIPVLRGIVAELKSLRRARPEYVHQVAARLWASGVHEARLLAGFLDVPELVTREQAEAWVSDIDSWDLCDQVVGLFAPTAFGPQLAVEWSRRQETFVKRAGFVLICSIAVHAKAVPDAELIAYLALVERECTDDRNFVKKAVNWALRQIGKRSPACHAAAIDTAERILARHPDSAAARWVARDALRELRSDAVVARLAARHPASQVLAH